MPPAAQREMDAFIASLPNTQPAPWWSAGVAPKLALTALVAVVSATLLSRGIVSTRAPAVRAAPVATPVTPPAPSAPVLRVSAAAPQAEALPRTAPPATTSEPSIRATSADAGTRAGVRRADPEAITPDQLAAEVAMLDRARRRLERSPRDALVELETHAGTYPRGALAAEREFLAVDATLRAGDRGAAERRAARFLQRYGDSPYARRVRALLEDTH
jgi:hypothetical protein